MPESLTQSLEKLWGQLLSPIPGDSPTGQYLFHDRLYDDIKEARREDDPYLDQDKVDFDGKLNFKKADWRKVYELCVTALTTRTKDLQIVIWLIEALVQIEGYAGLNKGLQLLTQLCNDNYWPKLFPPVEAGGELDFRLSALEWLNYDNVTRHDNFMRRLQSVPITAPTTTEAVPYTVFDRQSAYLLERTLTNKFKGRETEIAEQKNKARRDGKILVAQFLNSVELTPASFYATLSKELQESINLVGAVKQTLTSYCADQTPSFHHLLKTLGEIRQLVNTLLTEKSPAMATDDYQDEAAQSPVADLGETMGKTTASFRSRVEAYRRLEKAANYLAKVEPHSPVPYLVKLAISWQNMSFTEVINELKLAGGESLYKLLLEAPDQQKKK